ncbi:hypothetical protein MIND_00998400 [Mycena indigotica]|uniref:Uncharacterized protein n=1 Tax=Mycena indigotica TaxID=2126181 RepID=A0A8H6VY85_9AGAR|nr:uncharacterized protein MIND_00998400 [Mycena indigotica]KAF7294618.1 hypothetical protein MIND_00998400 [Mycena indigotica]
MNVNPYWSRLHATLDDVESNTSYFLYRRDPRSLYIPGDIVMTQVNTKLAFIFLEYLRSHNIRFNRQERAIEKTMGGAGSEVERPCLILDYDAHDPASRVVCFLATVRSSDSDELLPLFHHLGIPFGNSTEGGITLSPPLSSRLLFGLPVLRSTSNMRPYWMPVEKRLPQDRHIWVSNQLAYGELERTRQAVAEKTQSLPTLLPTIRSESAAWYREQARIGMRSRRRAILPLWQTIRQQAWHTGQPRFRDLTHPCPHLSPPRSLPPMDNNIASIVNDPKLDAASAYLSQALPLPRPPFHLPQPVNIVLQRTASTLTRGMIR